MRFNAEYREIRTTVRIPDELWELYVLANGSEESAVADVREFLRDYQSVRKEPSSASQVARWYMVGYVKKSIVPAVGFNPHPEQGKSASRDAR